MEDWICGECGTVFQRPVGVVGRLKVYCSKRCRKKAARPRAGLRIINLDECAPWDGEGYEPWTLGDADR